MKNNVINDIGIVIGMKNHLLNFVPPEIRDGFSIT